MVKLSWALLKLTYFKFNVQNQDFKKLTVSGYWGRTRPSPGHSASVQPGEVSQSRAENRAFHTQLPLRNDRPSRSACAAADIQLPPTNHEATCGQPSQQCGKGLKTKRAKPQHPGNQGEGIAKRKRQHSNAAQRSETGRTTQNQ